MNYIKPEDIKEYVSKNPEGIAGMSEELAVMVNHFAELIVRRTLDIVEAHTEIFQSDQARAMVEHIKQSVKTDFGVEE